MSRPTNGAFSDCAICQSRFGKMQDKASFSRFTLHFRPDPAEIP